MSNLEKLLADLGSWYWWVSVVAFGLAINLTSSYLKPTLDRHFERKSAKRTQLKKVNDLVFQQQSTQIAENPGLLYICGIQETRYRFLSLIAVVSAALPYLIASSLFGDKQVLSGAARTTLFGLLLLFAIACYVFGLYCHRKANQSSDLLHAARIRMLRAMGSEK